MGGSGRDIYVLLMTLIFYRRFCPLIAKKQVMCELSLYRLPSRDPCLPTITDNQRLIIDWPGMVGSYSCIISRVKSFTWENLPEVAITGSPWT